MKIAIIGTIKVEYNIRLIQRNKTNLPIPNGEYRSKLVLEPNTLDKILSNIQDISEYVTIQCNSKRVVFSGQGDIGNAKINLSKNDPDLKLINSTGTSSAVYNLDYMAKIIRNIGKTSKMVNLEYSNKNPVHIMFDMPSTIQVNYYLAPKLES